MSQVSRALLLAIVALLLFARPAGAAEPAAGDAPRISVYTIGTGEYLYSKFGHTALCVTPAGAADGTARCYDFGVSDPPDDFAAMTWGAFRGRANFAVVAVDEKVLIEAFSGMGRSVERQRLTLPPEQAKKIAAVLEDKLVRREHYAYHPSRSNCTTYVRDIVDEATGGALRAGEAPTTGATFRDLFETGMAGEILPLSVLALLMGPLEDRPTTWELLLLPDNLRDAIKARLGADIETVHTPGGMRLPTSRHVGRATLVLLGIVMAIVMFVARRRGTEARAVRAVTGILATLGLFAWAVAGLTGYAELRWTWSLLVLLPTDALLFGLTPGRRQRYLEARLVTCALLAALAVVGIVHQPVWAPALLVALPLAYLWLAPRLPNRAPTRAPAAARRPPARAVAK